MDTILIIKTSFVIGCIQRWKQKICDNPLLCIDHYNKYQAHNFKDNRHEQSIFLVLRKCYDTVNILAETYFELHWNSEKALSVSF